MLIHLDHRAGCRSSHFATRSGGLVPPQIGSGVSVDRHPSCDVLAQIYLTLPRVDMTDTLVGRGNVLGDQFPYRNGQLQINGPRKVVDNRR